MIMKIIKKCFYHSIIGAALYIVSLFYSYLSGLDISFEFFCVLCVIVPIFCFIFTFIFLWNKNERILITLFRILFLLLTYIVLFVTGGNLVIWIEDLFKIPTTDNVSGLMLLNCVSSVFISCIILITYKIIRHVRTQS